MNLNTIEFKITEDTLMPKIDKAVTLLQELTTMEFLFAVDKFDRRYSNKNCLATPSSLPKNRSVFCADDNARKTKVWL